MNVRPARRLSIGSELVENPVPVSTILTQRNPVKSKPTKETRGSNPFLVQECPLFPQHAVFVLGGGPSLSDFDFDMLRSKFVIGCNDAYQLGKEIVDVVFWGDWSWWSIHKKRVIEQYDGLVVTNHPKGRKNEVSSTGVKWMKRLSVGVSNQDGILSWNTNSGAAAINLALLFSARVVILLGFDMKLSTKDGSANWHPNEVSPPRASSYVRFLKNFLKIRDELPIKFPGTDIINANTDSAMEIFPKMDRERALSCY